jgi:hypothetical protein
MMSKSKKVLLMVAGLCLIITGTLASSGLTNRKPDDQEKKRIIREIENSPDQFLKVAANEDCPMKIIDAKVKEVPDHIFSRLTGTVARTTRVITVPDITLMNTSDKTITGMILFIRDPKTLQARGLQPHKMSVRPGESYNVGRARWSGEEKITTTDATGQARTQRIPRGMDSEKQWLNFALREDFYITVGQVTFEDGSKWQIKSGDAK